MFGEGEPDLILAVFEHQGVADGLERLLLLGGELLLARGGRRLDSQALVLHEGGQQIRDMGKSLLFFLECFLLSLEQLLLLLRDEVSVPALPHPQGG